MGMYHHTWLMHRISRPRSDTLLSQALLDAGSGNRRREVIFLALWVKYDRGRKEKKFALYHKVLKELVILHLLTSSLPLSVRHPC